METGVVIREGLARNKKTPAYHVEENHQQDLRLRPSFFGAGPLATPFSFSECFHYSKKHLPQVIQRQTAQVSPPGSLSDIYIYKDRWCPDSLANKLSGVHLHELLWPPPRPTMHQCIGLRMLGDIATSYFDSLRNLPNVPPSCKALHAKHRKRTNTLASAENGCETTCTSARRKVAVPVTKVQTKDHKVLTIAKTIERNAPMDRILKRKDSTRPTASRGGE